MFLKQKGFIRNYILFVIATALVGLFGATTLLTSHAGTQPFAIEAESGSLSTAVTSITDTTASSGHAARFGSLNEVRVDSFGAIGNGASDDTNAIQQALNAVKAGQTLVFTTGKTYNYSSVLRVTTANISLTGPATLQATNEQASTMDIAADSVAVSNLTFKVRSTTQRWGAPEQTMIYLDGHAYDSIKNVLVDGSPSAGVFIFGASHYLVQDVTVQNTRADAIHNTYGAHDGAIVRPIIKNVGDDGVAVVSYRGDGAICHDITVTSPKFYGSSNGRAYSVVGGNTITFNDIYADSSNAASIYIGSEGNPYYTYGVNNIQFVGGSISNANTNASVDHGAILILGGQDNTVESNISISNMTITNTRVNASRQVSLLQYAGSIQQVQLSNFTIKGGGSSLFGTLSVPANQYHTTGWTYNNTAVADR